MPRTANSPSEQPAEEWEWASVVERRDQQSQRGEKQCRNIISLYLFRSAVLVCTSIYWGTLFPHRRCSRYQRLWRTANSSNNLSNTLADMLHYCFYIYIVVFYIYVIVIVLLVRTCDSQLCALSFSQKEVFSYVSFNNCILILHPNTAVLNSYY